MESVVGTSLIVIVVGFLVFLLLRELMCWYYKINRMLAVLESIDSKLSRIALSAPMTSEGDASQPTASSTPPVDYSDSYLIQCPKCGNKEIIKRSQYKDPAAYTLFRAQSGGVLTRMTLTCTKCDHKFHL